MKKFMIVYTHEGETGAVFMDEYTKAKNWMMNLECGLGGYSELYERQEPNEENDYMGGYVFIEC